MTHWGGFWRLLGVVALAIYALLLLTFFRFLLRNIIVTALLCVSAGLAVYAVWLVFSGRRRRKLLGYALLAVGVVALAAELVYMILAISGVWAFAVFLLLMGAYALLANKLRSKYWSEARRRGESSAVAARFRKPYLIINPKSGNGRAVKAHIGELAEQQGITVIMLQKGDDVENAARRAASEGADVLGISGGDGSIGAVVKVALERNLPVVVLPGGTRCHFARDIGLEPERIADAIAGFRGVERRIDVGDINGRIFLNNASFGLYADIIDSPDYRGRKLETARNVLQALASGEKQPYDLQFRSVAKQYTSAIEILVGVNSYQTLNIFELGRREKLDAGVLQITVIDHLNDTLIRRMLETVGTGTVLHRKTATEIDQWEARAFRVTSGSGSLVTGVDGEREEYTSPVTVRILPKALSVYVPAEGLRNRPDPAFGWKTARQVGHMVGPASSGNR